ncbi:glycoside hydrolase family 26 protein [Quadrisphaera sp. DSM 44207]|uniref:glycoside hydrolase family 26 protein n=1 Tax=Quadrisphaera sp. DSM 44207 TaxID=1881057 RepID=UPI00087FA6B9|nr:glycosyl hydrolase [Quadrisphaera sp. DSM 44207]SDQ67111.1 Glycosyl hydrolase family 26 [Quadrisphaera sp. DSM 44207]
MTHPKNSTTRTRLRAAVVAALTAALLGGPVLTSATPPAEAASSALSGAYSGAGDVTGIKAFGAWRGRDVGVVTEFVDASTWTSIAKPTWAADRWKLTPYQIAWSVPMLPKTGGTIQAGAAGDYNAHFKTLSQTLVDRGLGDSVIRLGWEMNGTWFRWSAVKDPAAFVAYWRQVVTTMRSVPGASFTFEWAPNIGEGTAGFDKTRAYPGDEYVDLIGMSVYDQSWKYSSTQHVERWKEIVTIKGGLQWSVDFAKAHGKQNSLAEWGLSDRCDGHGGKDDPHYIQQVAAWVASHDYYYESYFDYRTSACEQHSITEGSFPTARTAYQGAFGPAAVSSADAAPAPNRAVPVAVDPSVLKVSWSSTRTNAKPLNWMGITSKVYVFADPGFATTSVDFYLDDPTRSRAPMTTDTAAPWDLVGGGTATNAKAFDASTLASGKHTITALFHTASGDRVATATFLR